MTNDDVLQELIELLALEKIEENLFRGQSQDLGFGAVFGGQVLGQALSAAAQTAPEGRQIHSLHSYFLRPGDVKHPIVYQVDRIRDGRSFTTRRVVAIQKGRAIFNLSASFQKEEEGFEHADPMPAVEPPEAFLSEQDLALKIIDQIPRSWRARSLSVKPIEIRPVDPINPLTPEPRESTQHSVWLRAIGELSDAPSLHRYLLAYASDFYFLPTAMRPHGVSPFTPHLQFASLDHAMWFHRPFRMDDWLLHVMESPSASGARGLVRGRFYNQEGALVASTMQEGLMRLWDGAPEP